MPNNITFLDDNNKTTNKKTLPMSVYDTAIFSCHFPDSLTDSIGPTAIHYYKKH